MFPGIQTIYLPINFFIFVFVCFNYLNQSVSTNQKMTAQKYQQQPFPDIQGTLDFKFVIITNKYLNDLFHKIFE